MTPAQEERRERTRLGTDLLKVIVKRERKTGRHLAHTRPEDVTRAAIVQRFRTEFPKLHRSMRRLP